MLDLRALRAAALQTRRTTSDKNHKDDHEDGEILDPTSFGSHDQHNHNSHGNYQSNFQYTLAICNTSRGTLSFQLYLPISPLQVISSSTVQDNSLTPSYRSQPSIS